jgi:hypothetical protein
VKSIKLQQFDDQFFAGVVHLILELAQQMFADLQADIPEDDLQLVLAQVGEGE